MNELQIGTIVGIDPTTDVDHMFDRLDGVGLNCVQVQCWHSELLTEDLSKRVMHQADAHGLKIVSFWSGYHGRMCWDFAYGPVTLGLVPVALRQRRMDDLMKDADFAEMLGVPAIITHFGFLPENRTDANFYSVVSAVAEIATYCKKKNLGFWFETGQETPVALLRVIEECGLDNLGINLDPANLICYGKGNPIDALYTFGKYVRSLHVKDAMPPTDGMHLGKEVQVGQGHVRFPEFIQKLQEIKFDGPFIIEREIGETPEQREQIIETVGNLKRWWNR